MNQPPNNYISVPHQALYAFVVQASQSVGLPTDKAELLAQLLVDNDLRGVFSHGTTQIATYARLMRSQERVATGYDKKGLDRWAKQAAGWAKRGDAFVYFISGAKVRNPAAAQALIEQVGPA